MLDAMDLWTSRRMEELRAQIESEFHHHPHFFFFASSSSSSMSLSSSLR